MCNSATMDELSRFTRNADGSYSKKPDDVTMPYQDAKVYFDSTKNKVPTVKDLLCLPERAFDRPVTNFPGHDTEGMFAKEGLLTTGIKIYQCRFDTGVVFRAACLEWSSRWNCILYHEDPVNKTKDMLDVSPFTLDKGNTLCKNIDAIQDSCQANSGPITLRLQPYEDYDSCQLIYIDQGGFDHRPFGATKEHYYFMHTVIMKDSEDWLFPKVVRYHSDYRARLTWHQVKTLRDFLRHCKPNAIMNPRWCYKDKEPYTHEPRILDCNVDQPDRRVPDLVFKKEMKTYQDVYFN